MKSDTGDYIEYHCIYLTQEVDLDPRAKRSIAKGLVLYRIYAKNAEDAILRLREQEPVEHPIIEMSEVRMAKGADGTPVDSSNLILPKEWGALGGPRARLVGKEN